MIREAADSINKTAGDWAVRVERGLSDVEEAEFQTWVRGDPRRAGAFGRMMALLERTERAAALGQSFDPQLFDERPRRINRRTWLISASAIAASATGLALLGALSRSQIYRTSKGEKQVVALRDGSVVTLNTATVISVSYSQDQRTIELRQGEALFDVAKDANRPFIVRAGDTRVRAIGTSFTVRRLTDAPVEVLVREGIVAVRRAGASEHTTTRVTANSKAIIAPENIAVQVTPVDAAAVSRELAWQEGRIVIEGETLAEAAAKFARYSNTRIVVDDPLLAKEEISGVFDAGDPIMFAKAMAVSLDAHAVIGADEVRISR